MPSRINIGPEDGPYVAINESSGNLQLEDNSGNVVAEWDETNAQWDFANNTLANVDALNSNSVNTEKLRTEPNRVVVGLSDDIVVADDTITTIEWDTVLDGDESLLSENAVEVPSDVSHAKLNCGIEFEEEVKLTQLDPRLNGSSVPYAGGSFLSETTARDQQFVTGWIEVDGGDEFTTRVRQESGGDLELLARNRITSLEVWFL